MGFGIVNTPGAPAVERKNTEAALLARMESVEKTLSGNEKIPGTSEPTPQVTAKVGQIYINVVTGEEWKCVAVNNGNSVWEKQTTSAVGLTAEQVGAVPESTKGKPGGVAALDASGKVPEAQLPSMVPFVAGTSAPNDKKKLWIDTTANSGGLKYWNGSAWVAVPVLYT